MKSTFNPQIPQNIFLQQNHAVSSLRSRCDVRQDKSAALRGRVASAQPERPAPVMRAHQEESQPPRTQNTTTPNRKTVPLTLWVKPFVKAEVQRLVSSIPSFFTSVYLESASTGGIHVRLPP